MQQAAHELVAYAAPGSKRATCRKRMIVLSDGADTCSSVEPHVVALFLQDNDIVVDAITVGRDGESVNPTLRAIAKATGGLAFHPDTLKNALKLNELETFLRLGERPPVFFKRAPRIKSAGALERYTSTLFCETQAERN